MNGWESLDIGVPRKKKPDSKRAEEQQPSNLAVGLRLWLCAGREILKEEGGK